MTRTSVLLSVLAALALPGCGDDSARPTTHAPARTQTAGAEQAARPAPEPDAGEAPAPTPSGPVTVTIRLVVGGRSVAGHVEILDENGSKVAEGDAGSALTVQSGVYSIVGKINDEHVLVDKPQRQIDMVELTPGAPRTESIEFAIARVRFVVRVRGRPTPGARITLMRPGTTDHVAEFQAGTEHIMISAGRYEADVRAGAMVTHVRGIALMDGGTQDIPIDVQ